MLTAALPAVLRFAILHPQAAQTASQDGVHSLSDDPASTAQDVDDNLDDLLLGGAANGGSGHGAGDEFMAVKPWVGAIREPSAWKEGPEDALPPAAELRLSFVYGYQVRCRHRHTQHLSWHDEGGAESLNFGAEFQR